MIIKNIANIDIFLRDKFSDLKGDDFICKSPRKSCENDSIMNFDSMIEKLSQIVEQHLIDEDFNFDESMPNICDNQWAEWLSEYEIPESNCPLCGGQGCNYCLMTSY